MVISISAVAVSPQKTQFTSLCAFQGSDPDSPTAVAMLLLLLLPGKSFLPRLWPGSPVPPWTAVDALPKTVGRAVAGARRTSRMNSGVWPNVAREAVTAVLSLQL